MMIQLVLAVCAVFIQPISAWNFDCHTMDINSNVPALQASAIPYDVRCSLLSDSDIEVSVSSPTAQSYTGIMMQVHRANRPIGTFRTRSTTNTNPDAVGTDYEITCSDTKYAQVSIDRRLKKQTEGRWYNRGQDDLSGDNIQCVVSVIESENRRWVRVAVPLNGQRSAPRSPSQIVPPRVLAPAPPQRRPPPPPTRPPTTLPPTTTTERDWNAGKIRVANTNYPRHCKDEFTYGRVPLSHTSCEQYITVAARDARAIHTCPSLLCFDTQSCSCRFCDEVFCPSMPSQSNILIEIYDSANEARGKVSWKRQRQPGLTSGYTMNINREGDLNPDGIPSRGVHKGSRRAGNRKKDRRSRPQTSATSAIGDLIRSLVG